MRPMPLTIYIASPYTKGDPVINTRESFLMADKLLELGFNPFPPLYSMFWHFLSPKPYETWTELDMWWVMKSDAMIRMPGESSGADNEVMFALTHGIPVFYCIEGLVQWRESLEDVTKALLS